MMFIISFQASRRSASYVTALRHFHYYSESETEFPLFFLKYETVNAEKQKKNKWTNSAGQEELPDEIREIPWKKDIGESQKCK